MEVLKTQNLHVSLWHNDTFGQNSFLGEVDLDLSEWDFSNTQINEYTLKARVKSSYLYAICMYNWGYLSDIYFTCLNALDFSPVFSNISVMFGRQQRTDESCPEIPATDIPQWADGYSVFVAYLLWVSTLTVIWLPPQLRKHPGWRLVRCRSGWKTARIYLQPEEILSTHLWNGGISPNCQVTHCSSKVFKTQLKLKSIIDNNNALSDCV